MIKYTLSILLAFAVVIPSWITIPFLQYEKYITKKEIKHKLIEGIDKDQLVLLVFDTSEVDKLVSWEHSKEFEYRDEMYDVVEREESGDSVYFWCWWDHEETQLNLKLKHMLKRSLADNPKIPHHSKRLSEYLHSLFYEEIVVYTTIYDSIEGYKPIYCAHYHSLNFPPPVPPPQA